MRRNTTLISNGGSHMTTTHIIKTKSVPGMNTLKVKPSIDSIHAADNPELRTPFKSGFWEVQNIVFHLDG
jgi:hypothetical protein